MFGQDAKVRLGEMRMDLASDVEAEPAKWRAHMALLDRHERFRDFRYMMQVADEAKMTVSVSGKPIFDSAGRFLGYRGTARDITSTIEAEAKLREAKIAAEAASAAKTAFLANMSHELRTPLNAIIGFAEALTAGLFGPMNGKHHEYVRDILDSGHHLLLLISDLLDVAKIEAGKLELHREPVDIADEIAACLRLVQAKADAGGVALVTDVAAVAEHPVDRRAIRQVLLNLLSNAVKFTPAGGRVLVTACRDATGNLVLSVADTGVEIAPEDLAKIIVPFGALARNASLSRTREGTGLGLPLSKSRVELHGGSSRSVASPDAAPLRLRISRHRAQPQRDPTPSPFGDGNTTMAYDCCHFWRLCEPFERGAPGATAISANAALFTPKVPRLRVSDRDRQHMRSEMPWWAWLLAGLGAWLLSALGLSYCLSRSMRGGRDENRDGCSILNSHATCDLLQVDYGYTRPLKRAVWPRSDGQGHFSRSVPNGARIAPLDAARSRSEGRRRATDG